MGDRRPLFRAVAPHVAATSVLYPGSYVDIAPSFVWSDITYVDVDARTRRFFADEEGVRTIVQREAGAPATPSISFVAGDYTEPLPIAPAGFDLLISLYAGLVSQHRGDHLRVGGTLLVNSSHGDAAMASVDPRFELAAVVQSRSGGYAVSAGQLDTFLVPKRASDEPVAEIVDRTGRGIAYTKTPFAYLFRRVR